MTHHPSFVEVGTRAVIESNENSGHGFDLDTVVEVFRFDNGGDPEWRDVQDHDNAWFVDPSDLVYLDPSEPHLRDPKVGDVITFREHPVGGLPPRGFEVGQKVTVTAVSEHGLPYRYVAIDADKTDHPSWNVEWFAAPDRVEPEKVERPTIDFGGDGRATARDYACSLLSKGLKPENHAVLSDAANGYVVDAYALNEAVLDAMRQSATRYSQSSQRKEHAKRAAYLGHITQAVLENHADQLPVYEPGERSRAVQSWKEIAASHQEHIETLTREADERQELLDQAARELEKARYELDLGTEYREKADAEVTRLLLKLEEANRRAELAGAERDAAAATIGYVAERLDDVGRAEMLGYWEGVKDATLPVDDES